MTNSARPRFDWENSTLCPPKIRSVIDRLADDDHSEHRKKLRDCIRGSRPYVGYLYAKNLDVAFHKIRCTLKLRCPWCLRPENVLARRAGDFKRVRIASQLLGANEKNVRVWLLDWPSDGRSGSGERISRLLGEANDRERHYPAMNGLWGAELAHVAAVDFRAKIPKHIGPKPYRKLFLFASPQALLDYKRLGKSLPGVEIRPFHGNLLLAWQTYLSEWADSQWNASAQDTADWMVSKERNFLALGRLRHRKTGQCPEASSPAKRERIHGDCQLITYATRKQARSQVEAITERNLPRNYEKLKREPLSANNRDKIMSRVRPHLAIFPVEPEPEEPMPLTPKQIDQNSAERRELERQMLADDIAQRVVDELERRQQLSDLPEPDCRQSKPLVQ